MSENTAEEVQKSKVQGEPFKQGYDPRRNSKGRPKGARNIKTIFREAMEILAKQKGYASAEALETEIARMGVEKALKGDIKFYQDLQDRLHGKPVLNVDHTTDGESINKIEVEIVKNGDSKNEIDKGVRGEQECEDPYSA